jgi:anti-sigma B factor antagonist
VVHPSSAPAPVTALAVSVDLPNSLVSVAGELDRDSAHHLLDAMAVLTTRTSRRWRLDAGAVTFCDAGGVRALRSAHALAAAHGRSLDVERTSRQVDRLVELVGHEQVFPADDGSGVPAGTADGATPTRGASSSAKARRIRCGSTGTA